MSMLVETEDDHLLPNSQASVAVNVLTRQTRSCTDYSVLSVPYSPNFSMDPIIAGR